MSVTSSVKSIVHKLRPADSGLPAKRWLTGYTGATLRQDIFAGIALAALALPQSLGYAAVAGVPVQVGLYTLPAAMIAYALLGTSRILVVGPVSTVSVLSGSIVAGMAQGDVERAVELTAALAILAGLFLILAGVTRIGWLAEFLSAPIVTGFVTGLVILIVLGELPSILRVSVPAGPVVDRLESLAGSLPDVHRETTLVGLAALAILIVGRRLAPAVPWSLIVLVLGIASTSAFDLTSYGVVTVGAVPTGLPVPTLPFVDLQDIPTLITGGLAIAGVGLAEGLSAARLFAGKSGERVETDAELVATGVANAASGFFGGMGVAGSLSKTAAVDRAGAKTQMTGVVASLLVVIVLVAFAGSVANLPRAVLSAIVIAAVVPLIDLSAFRRYKQVRRNDFVSAMVALLGVVFLGPLNGLLLAVAQSIAGLVYRSIQVKVDPMGKVPGEKAAWGSRRRHPERHCPDGILVLRLSGPLFWANANTIDDRIMAMVEGTPDLRAVVIDLEATTQLDTTSADVLSRIINRFHARGIDVFLVRVMLAVRRVLQADGLLARIGEDHLWHSISAGVSAAKKSAPLPVQQDVEIDEEEVAVDQERIAAHDRDAEGEEEHGWWGLGSLHWTGRRGSATQNDRG